MMKLMLADLNQWDQSTVPLEDELEECRSASTLAVQEQKAEAHAVQK